MGKELLIGDTLRVYRGLTGNYYLCEVLKTKRDKYTDELWYYVKRKDNRNFPCGKSRLWILH